MNKEDFLAIQKCKYCGGYDYFGEFRWKNGRCLCRRCYRADWEDRNGKVYPWDDLDASPFPTAEEIAKISK